MDYYGLLIAYLIYVDYVLVLFLAHELFPVAPPVDDPPIWRDPPGHKAWLAAQREVTVMDSAGRPMPWCVYVPELD